MEWIDRLRLFEAQARNLMKTATGEVATMVAGRRWGKRHAISRQFYYAGYRQALSDLENERPEVTQVEAMILLLDPPGAED